LEIKLSLPHRNLEFLVGFSSFSAVELQAVAAVPGGEEVEEEEQRRRN
jgi:hypothetical protein